jgi:hypothetical protein
MLTISLVTSPQYPWYGFNVARCVKTFGLQVVWIFPFISRVGRAGLVSKRATAGEPSRSIRLSAILQQSIRYREDIDIFALITSGNGVLEICVDIRQKADCFDRARNSFRSFATCRE